MVSDNNDAAVKTLEDYQQAVDSSDKKREKAYKAKPLKMYVEFLKQLAPYALSGKSVRPYIEDIVSILIGAKRYFDLASIFIFLRNQKIMKTETGKMLLVMEDVLRPYVNELFTKSLTYSSDELDEMFSEVFGNDHALLMELVSHIFKEYSLFNAKLSQNIYEKFIEVADSDLRGFIQHSDSKFLAFYLSNLPRLPFVPPEHISRWTNLILDEATGAGYIEKIIQALKEHPSVEILLIFLLSSREKARHEALSLLKDCADMGLIDEKIFCDSGCYFMKKALSGDFYDFHAISRTQKEMFASLIYMSSSKDLAKQVVDIIKEKNTHNDPKIIETAKIFVILAGKLSRKDPELKIILEQMLRDSNVELEIREDINKSLAQFK